MSDKFMPLKPRSTEQTYAQSHSLNVFTFDVPVDANKIQIKKAVEAQFDVKVANVRTSIIKGKDARSIRIGARYRANVSGLRADKKKAYVTLTEGHTLPIFAAIDEQVEKEKKAAEKAGKSKKKDEKKSKEEPKK